MARVFSFHPIKWLLGRLVYNYAVTAVRDCPGGIKYELCPVGQKVIIDLVWGIAGSVVIIMGAIKIENDRDIVLREVVMVASVVKPIGIILVIIGVIQLNVGVLVIDSFRKCVQFRT